MTGILRLMNRLLILQAQAAVRGETSTVAVPVHYCNAATNNMLKVGFATISKADLINVQLWGSKLGCVPDGESKLLENSIIHLIRNRIAFLYGFDPLDAVKGIQHGKLRDALICEAPVPHRAPTLLTLCSILQRTSC